MPNKRVQRTRLRSPLTRRPLGHSKGRPVQLAAAVALLIATVATGEAPFALAIVPSSSVGDRQGIVIGRKPPTFYVVLTNVSAGPQLVWEKSNSWAYQSMSLEITLADGKLITLTRKSRAFTRKFPSTFSVLPGEVQIYPIRLDAEWEENPEVSFAAPVLATVRAVYGVSQSAEAAERKVWVGRVASEGYRFMAEHR